MGLVQCVGPYCGVMADSYGFGATQVSDFRLTFALWPDYQSRIGKRPLLGGAAGT
jgi:hypothetical protein